MAESSLCKHQSDTTSLEDQISKLPDEILAAMLSLLTVKEAGRTSVLSNRWLNLWKFTTHLKFEVPPVELRITQSEVSNEFKKPLRSRYVTWVNQVLISHQRCSIDEFKVQFDLDASFSEDIDEWIKFMISKRPKTVVIDLTSYYGTDNYSLSQECNDFFKSVSNLSNIMCLSSLTLGAVNVDGELIEYLLSKCHHLEMLSITSSQKLLRLKVAGPSLPLKYLKIYRCDSLENIEISAPSLVTLFYYGNPVKFAFGQNPLLSELHVVGVYDEKPITACLPLFSRYFSQIETLSLRISVKSRANLEIQHVSVLKNLKHLRCNIQTILDKSLVGLTKFITAAPSLEKLTLQLTVCSPSFDLSRLGEQSVQVHERLKQVEIHGYLGCRSHLELARYLVKSATNLEKMVIDQSSPILVNSEQRTELVAKLVAETIEKVAKLVAEQAEELKRSLPPRAELVVM